MTDWASSFDSYARRARLYPALLALAPAVALALAAIPAVNIPSVAAAAMTLLASFGVLYLLADIARARGVRVQNRLLREWGGWPTTLFLRQSDSNLPAPTKARYRLFLSQRIPSWTAPTEDQEIADPVVAQELYDSAVQWLKEATRDPQFRLVHRENANYGFRRNLLGLKPIGLAIAFSSLLIGALFAFGMGTAGGWFSAPVHFELALVPVSVWVTLALSVIALAGWVLIVTDAYVRESAEAYARALLACCDKL